MSRPVKGTRPTVDTVDGRADNAPEATCPTCGAPGSGFLRHDRAIVTAQYLCPAGHLWVTKWTAVA